MDAFCSCEVEHRYLNRGLGGAGTCTSCSLSGVVWSQKLCLRSSHIKMNLDVFQQMFSLTNTNLQNIVA